MPKITIRVLDGLSAEQVERVTAISDAAALADGVQPLSEHVRLHLRHGGDRGHGHGDGDRHLLAIASGSQHADRIVGYAHLDPTDVIAGPAAEVVVAPEHRGQGVGRALLAGALDTVASLPTRAPLRLWAHGHHPAAQALAASFGFTEGRRLEQWRRSLTGLEPARVPDGVRVRGFRPTGADGVDGIGDEPAWLELNALAFADHPEQGRWTASDLHSRMAEDWFDPSGFLVAESVADGRLLGFHWTKVHGALRHRHGSGDHDEHDHVHDHSPIGEVYVVGVHPEAHGRGLGRALTLAGLHWLRDAGLTEAMLYVEADNGPARAVYHGLGFRCYDTDVMFYRHPDSDTAGSAS